MDVENQEGQENGNNTGTQHRKQYEWLKPHQWKPGQSGNPEGSKPGKKLKTFVREYLESMDDEEKLRFLKENVSPELAWRMAECNPQSDITTGGEKFPTPILNDLSSHHSLKEDTGTEEKA